MPDYTPIEYLTKLQKLKYRAAIFPIILVFVSFGINLAFEIDQAKYLSIIGLLWYIVIIMKFRVRGNYPPESKSEIILSPIYGKIIKIENNNITISKGIFHSADLRYSGQNIDVKLKSKQVNYFENQPILIGRLIGVISSSAICICSISNEWKIEINIGDKVVAGETILATK